MIGVVGQTAIPIFFCSYRNKPKTNQNIMNEEKKDFNAMLHNSKDMPKIKTIDKEEVVSRYGGRKMLLAPPIDYDKVIKRIPHGKLLTIERIRNHLAYQYDADFTCPLTAGVFTGIVAWASHQRTEDITPYWRVVKNKGELNPKFPGGIEAQKQKLEAEGHSIVSKGKKNLKYYVKDYEKSLFQL